MWRGNLVSSEQFQSRAAKKPETLTSFMSTPEKMKEGGEILKAKLSILVFHEVGSFISFYESRMN